MDNQTINLNSNHLNSVDPYSSYDDHSVGQIFMNMQ